MGESIQCWQCGTRMTLDELASNDGDCPRCEVEVHLAEYLDNALSRVATLEAENANLRAELERLAGNGPTSTISATRELREILAAPRQPEGEWLEVVAWQDAEDPLNTTGERRQMHGWATDGYPVVELCRLSDAQRAIAERDATIERLEAGIPRLQEHAHQMRQQRDRLRAENERLRKSCAGVIARSVHETRAATNSALDGYLAAGIAATDAELDTLRKQLDEARELESCAVPK